MLMSGYARLARPATKLGQGSMPYLPLITTLTGPLVGIWLGVVLTERKTYRERAWELKARAYSAIFEALEKMRRSYERSYNAEVRGRERDEAEEEADNHEFRSTRDQLFILIASESWILPDEVSHQITSLEKQLSIRRDSYFEGVDDGRIAVRDTAARLRHFARRDMATLPRSWRPRLFSREGRGDQATLPGKHS
ncbi:hypothetical protein S2M10_00310 [Sphingomonas sp. S2M10]|nr:hypothetical protein [Sphingomonas sp. S2M10]